MNYKDEHVSKVATDHQDRVQKWNPLLIITEYQGTFFNQLEKTC